MLKLPTLYKKTSKGAIQIWEIEVTDSIITVTHGQQDGKKQINSETITNGKNIGKANETSPSQQAEAEAQSQWNKKKDRQSYVEHLDFLTTERVVNGNVMLAHKYSEHADKMPEECYIEPKLDGHRCKAVILDGVCTLYSRTNSVIKGVPHINLFLQSNYDNIIFDGELYNHDYKERFEELTSFIRQETPKDGYEAVEYHIYDVMWDAAHDTTLMFCERYAKMVNIVKETSSPLRLVKAEKCKDAVDVETFFRKYLSDGYEGAMLRNPNSLYENKRSYSLQKVKEMDDAEFKIIAVTEGRGKLVGHAMLTCITENDTTFDCKLKGSFENLKKIFDNKDEYIGKVLTVQYQGKTKYGIPRFPVGLRFREDV